MLLSCNGREDITITILQTTDLHGAILPYDYIERCKTDVSLANISGYIKKIRKQRESLILLDGGDIIQDNLWFITIILLTLLQIILYRKQ
jgi:2',3'-cyclic-nucleotide 2'-phosphodiesterase/3'-nucleotidase